ncbi:MAG: hypothetical protein M1831_001283 [Alyxoria varia]|nr:MAG: hypothetical protein M1831_001283 [Alyxoria varia]
MDSNSPQAPDNEYLHIDGNLLEGGGQLVRVALGLSAITRIPVHLTNIRGRRSGGGGLKNQHLVSAHWLGMMCRAEVEGSEIGSKDLKFKPGAKDPADPERLQFRVVRFNDGVAVRQVKIDLQSAGSIALVLQAIFPYLLFATTVDPNDQSINELHQLPIHLTIAGGTHVWTSPTLSWQVRVLFHNLQQLFPSLSKPLIQLSPYWQPRFGWTVGRYSPGVASYLIHPVPYGSTLPAFSLSRRKPITRIGLTIFAPGTEGMDILRSEAVKQAEEQFPEATVEVEECNDSKQKLRWYLMIFAEEQSEEADGDGKVSGRRLRIGRDYFHEGRIGTGEKRRQTAAEFMASKVIRELKDELATEFPLDRKSIDQLAILQGLSKGMSVIWEGKKKDKGNGTRKTNTANLHQTTKALDKLHVSSKPSSDSTDKDLAPRTAAKSNLSTHAITARWVTESMLPTLFTNSNPDDHRPSLDGPQYDGTRDTCVGAGYRSGGVDFLANLPPRDLYRGEYAQEVYRKKYAIFETLDVDEEAIENDKIMQWPLVGQRRDEWSGVPVPRWGDEGETTPTKVKERRDNIW